MDTQQVTLPIDALKACTLFQAKRDVRYYLQGVAVLGGGRFMAATDGHVLIVRRIADKPTFGSALDGTGELILSADCVKALLAAARANPYKPRELFVEYSHNAQTVSREGFTWPLVDARFPDVFSVLKSATTGQAPADTAYDNGRPNLDPDLAALAQKAYRLLYGKEAALELHDNGYSPAYWADDSTVILVMPRRGVAGAREAASKALATWGGINGRVPMKSAA